MPPRRSIADRIVRLIEGAIVLVVGSIFWIGALGVLVALVVGLVAATKAGNVEGLWLVPLGAAMWLLTAAMDAPAYFWLAILVLLWIDFRLGRLEESIWGVRRGLHRLRHPRKPTARELEERDWEEKIGT